MSSKLAKNEKESLINIVSRGLFIPALQSIFPPMSLLKFMQQGRIDKRAQICELGLVVAGIRIYNWVI